MNKKIIIAIDGFSSTGKSTIAKLVAKKYNYIYVDTGAMYRASKVAAISEVRKKLVAEQQLMGKNSGIVMDGRDIGTVVFPDAELKLFMTASADKRANRRYKELIDRGDKVDFKDILFNVEERDRIDSTRKDSPLMKAKDAIEFDNSDMGINEQFDRICSIVDRRIED